MEHSILYNFDYAFTTFLYAGVLVIILNRILSTHYKQTIDKAFIKLVVFGILFMGADVIWGITLYGVLGQSDFDYVITYIWYAFLSLTAYMLTDYIIAYLGSEYKHKERITIARICVLIVQIVILFVNGWTDILFYFDGGQFFLGDFYYLPYILMAFFMFASFLFTGIQFLKTKSRIEKKQCVAAMLFSFATVCGGVLQLVEPQIPFISGSIMIGTVVLYVFNLNDMREQDLAEKYDNENVLRKETLEIVRILSSNYMSVYYVDLNTSNMTIYRASEEVTALFGDVLYKQVNFSQVLLFYLDKMIHNSDKEHLTNYARPEFLRSLVKDDPIYTHTYRVGTEENFKYFQMRIVKVNKEEEASAIILGISDVDEQVRKEEEYKKYLEISRDSATAASSAKSTFLFNMSHDIRTPMNAIIGFTDMANKHIDEKDRVVDCLSKVKASSNHLLALINDVLDMARIESGKVELEETNYSITDEAENLTNIMNVNAANKNMTLNLDIDVQHDYVFGDKLHSNRVMQNLVSNAIKYTLEGGRVDYIIKELPCKEEGKAIYQYVVKDNGIGMSPKFVETIFDSFSRERTSQTENIQGTGLGMAITKQLTDLMGGDIKVESKQGVGTTITVILKYTIVDKVAEDAAVEEAAQIDLTGKRVLLVEDNELNREIAQEILQEVGIEVETAEDGEEAVKMVTKKAANYYDFVLMDIQMPKMDGYQATQVIRSHPKFAKLCIIAMTANAFEEDKKKAIDMGMNGHIAKPIDISQLLITIKKILNM